MSDPFICQDFWQIYFVVTQKDGVEESDQNSLSSSWGILSAESDTGMLTDCMVLMSAKSLLRCWLRHSTALLDRLHMLNVLSAGCILLHPHVVIHVPTEFVVKDTDIHEQ